MDYISFIMIWGNISALFMWKERFPGIKNVNLKVDTFCHYFKCKNEIGNTELFRLYSSLGVLD